MIDAQEVAFLRSLAENPADDITRAVYADWLEERGDAARAEFVRAGETARKHELLEAHGAGWAVSLGVAVEDVRYEKGVVVAARLSRWDEEIMSPRFLTLTELDLSAIGMTDDDLSAFAANADLPGLRKLLLYDNALTDAGAAALAAATGMPRLETVYLFGNPVSDMSRYILEGRNAFRLTTLDLGEPEEGYAMSPGQADAGRRRQVREEFLPALREMFAKHPLLKSAALSVAQYWCDEAADAVHGSLMVSELPEPIENWANNEADPNIPNTPLKKRWGKGYSSLLSMGEHGIRWDDNFGAIPLWAAFSAENGGGDDSDGSEYVVAVRFHRHGGYELCEPSRPYLDGVQPQDYADEFAQDLDDVDE